MSAITHAMHIRVARFVSVSLMLLGVACSGDLAVLSGVADVLGSTRDGNRVVAGLKEALRVGTQQAVSQTSVAGGFLDNPAIRIQLPPALDTMAQGLRVVGYGTQVDQLYVAMNRAAERSAAEAADVFLMGIRQMSIQDAMGILNGGETAATEFFQRTTRATLFQRFEPIVAEKLGQVGAVQQYDQLLKRFEAIPFTDKPDLDIHHYVTNQALDGLFEVLGSEERKIRTDPAARITPLLREVFGR